MNKAFIYRAGIAVGICVWLGLVGTGFRTLWLYAYTPGPAADIVRQWPDELPRDTTRPTLVMLVHPGCTCSEASVGELARIMARSTGPVDVRVIFRPVADGPDLRQSRLWRQVAELPNVTVEIDPTGEIVSRLGALVSGQALLFDRDGRLLFSGGITAARGHSGDNDGEDAIIAALNRGSAPLAATPVFGCLLQERAAS